MCRLGGRWPDRSRREFAHLSPSPPISRPGGNITGIYFFTQGLQAKRLGLLHEMVPTAPTIAVLINPNYSPAHSQLRDAREASSWLGLQLVVLRANTESDFAGAH